MKLTYDINDQSYTPGNTKYCDLIIYLSDAMLAMTTFDTRLNKYIALQAYEIPGLRVFRNREQISSILTVLEPGYRKRKLLISNPWITLVPSEYFSPDLSESYFTLNYELKRGENISYDFIKNLNSYLVYALNINLSTLNEIFNPDLIFHSTTTFLTNILSDVENYLSNKVFLDIEKNFIRIIVLKEGKLWLCNSYYYKKEEDILYHLLNVSKQMEIDPDKDKYYFSGIIFKESETYQMLFRHIRYALLIPRHNFFSYSKSFDTIPSHTFYSIFTAALCE
jgi:hypothetical protein